MCFSQVHQNQWALEITFPLVPSIGRWLILLQFHQADTSLKPHLAWVVHEMEPFANMMTPGMDKPTYPITCHCTP